MVIGGCRGKLKYDWFYISVWKCPTVSSNWKHGQRHNPASILATQPIPAQHSTGSTVPSLCLMSHVSMSPVTREQWNIEFLFPALCKLLPINLFKNSMLSGIKSPFMVNGGSMKYFDAVLPGQKSEQSNVRRMAWNIPANILPSYNHIIWHLSDQIYIVYIKLWVKSINPLQLPKL